MRNVTSEPWANLFATKLPRRALGGFAGGSLAALAMATGAEADRRKQRARRRKRRPRQPDGQKPPTSGRPPLGGAQQLSWEFAFEWGTRGSDQGEFLNPNGVAVNDLLDLVYVVDTDNDRIQAFDKSGVFFNEWGSFGFDHGQFALPIDIALDGNGNVFVTDQLNVNVQKFTPDGNFVTAWGDPDDGIQTLAEPAGQHAVFDGGRRRGLLQRNLLRPALL